MISGYIPEIFLYLPLLHKPKIIIISKIELFKEVKIEIYIFDQMIKVHEYITISKFILFKKKH